MGRTLSIDAIGRYLDTLFTPGKIEWENAGKGTRSISDILIRPKKMDDKNVLTGEKLVSLLSSYQIKFKEQSKIINGAAVSVFKISCKVLEKAVLKKQAEQQAPDLDDSDETVNVPMAELSMAGEASQAHLAYSQDDTGHDNDASETIYDGGATLLRGQGKTSVPRDISAGAVYRGRRQQRSTVYDLSAQGRFLKQAQGDDLCPKPEEQSLAEHVITRQNPYFQSAITLLKDHLADCKLRLIPKDSDGYPKIAIWPGQDGNAKSFSAATQKKIKASLGERLCENGKNKQKVMSQFYKMTYAELIGWYGSTPEGQKAQKANQKQFEQGNAQQVKEACSGLLDGFDPSVAIRRIFASGTAMKVVAIRFWRRDDSMIKENAFAKAFENHLASKKLGGDVLVKGSSFNKKTGELVIPADALLYWYDNIHDKSADSSSHQDIDFDDGDHSFFPLPPELASMSESESCMGGGAALLVQKQRGVAQDAAFMRGPIVGKKSLAQHENANDDDATEYLAGGASVLLQQAPGQVVPATRMQTTASALETDQLAGGYVKD